VHVNRSRPVVLDRLAEVAPRRGHRLHNEVQGNHGALRNSQSPGTVCRELRTLDGSRTANRALVAQLDFLAEFQGFGDADLSRGVSLFATKTPEAVVPTDASWP
jgi:hypothetical protein